MECVKLQEQLKEYEKLKWTFCYNKERFDKNPECIKIGYTLWGLNIAFTKCKK